MEDIIDSDNPEPYSVPVISQFIKRFREAAPVSSKDREQLLPKESFWWLEFKDQEREKRPPILVDKSLDINSTLSSIKMTKSYERNLFDQSSVLSSMNFDTDEVEDAWFKRCDAIFERANDYVKQFNTVRSGSSELLTVDTDDEIEQEVSLRDKSSETTIVNCMETVTENVDNVDFADKKGTNDVNDIVAVDSLDMCDRITEEASVVIDCDRRNSFDFQTKIENVEETFEPLILHDTVVPSVEEVLSPQLIDVLIKSHDELVDVRAVPAESLAFVPTNSEHHLLNSTTDSHLTWELSSDEGDNESKVVQQSTFDFDDDTRTNKAGVGETNYMTMEDDWTVIDEEDIEVDNDIKLVKAQLEKVEDISRVDEQLVLTALGNNDFNEDVELRLLWERLCIVRKLIQEHSTSGNE